MPRKSADAAVIDLSHAFGLLVRRVRAAAAAQELSLTEAAVMSRLAKDGPATTADLARAESMKPQSMGATIAALEDMGMVERKPHPTDGRQVNIELTAKGEALRSRADAAVLRVEQRMLARLTAATRHGFREHLKACLRALDEHAVDVVNHWGSAVGH